jgi:hypothetical protein
MVVLGSFVAWGQQVVTDDFLGELVMVLGLFGVVLSSDVVV